jgi:hypothetical protein
MNSVASSTHLAQGLNELIEKCFQEMGKYPKNLKFISTLLEKKQALLNEETLRLYRWKKLLRKAERETNLFARLPDDIIRLITNQLTLKERAYFCSATKAVASSLEMTNEKTNTGNLQIVLQNLNPQINAEEIKQLQSLRSQNICSCLLAQNEKQQRLDSRIYKILKPAWEKDAQLQRHAKIAFFIFSQNVHALVYLSLSLKNKKSFILKIVAQEGTALDHASETLKNDKDVVLAAVKEYGRALEYASDELRDNKDIVLAAVAQDGMALYRASKRLQKDKDVVLAAVKQNGIALEYSELKDDQEIVLAAIAQTGWSLKYTSDNLKNNKNFILIAMRHNGIALAHVPGWLQQDKEVVLTAVRQRGTAIQYASSELQNDKEVALAAVKQESAAFNYVSDALQNDEEVILAAKMSNLA